MIPIIRVRQMTGADGQTRLYNCDAQRQCTPAELAAGIAGHIQMVETRVLTSPSLGRRVRNVNYPPAVTQFDDTLSPESIRAFAERAEVA